LLGLGAAGAGGFLLARMVGPGERPAPSQPAKAQAKSQEPVGDNGVAKEKASTAEKETPRRTEVAERAPPKTPGQKEVSLPAKEEPILVLTELDKQLETYHKLIKPQPGEWKFMEVPWMRTVWEARKKAADEGKPLFIWYMAGEPLGQC